MGQEFPDEKYGEWFDREHLKKDIKGKSIKGGASTVSAQVFAFVLSLVSNIILARLLMPSDFGLIKMVTAITGVVLIFKDLGLSQAIVQSPNLNHSLVSKTFWLNILASFVLAGIIAALGPLLVALYDEPELLNITLVYAPIALISGFTVQHTALLKRQMQFRHLARIKVVSAVIGVVVGIGMAWMGYGFWALLGLNGATVLANVVLVWNYCSWRPKFTRLDRSISYFAKFGADMTGFGVINYFSRNLDNVLIGTYVGDTALGFYDRAYQLLMVPITQLRDPLNSVGIPALSSMKPDSADFSRYYYRYLFLMAFFSMPLTAFMGVAAEPLVLVLLGERWLPSADLFSLLAIIAFIQPIASTRGMVMISAGHSRKVLYWGVFNAVVTIAAFFIGISLGGTEGLIIGYISAGYLLLVPSLIYCFRGTSVSVKGFFARLAFPAAYSLVGALAVCFVLHLCRDMFPFVSLAIAFVVFLCIYTGAWLALPVSREQLAGVKEIGTYLIAEIKKKRNQR